MVATVYGGTNEEYTAHSETMIVFHMCFSTCRIYLGPIIEPTQQKFYCHRFFTEVGKGVSVILGKSLYLSRPLLLYM